MTARSIIYVSFLIVEQSWKHTSQQMVINVAKKILFRFSKSGGKEIDDVGQWWVPQWRYIVKKFTFGQCKISVPQVLCRRKFFVERDHQIDKFVFEKKNKWGKPEKVLLTNYYFFADTVVHSERFRICCFPCCRQNTITDNICWN